MFLPDVKAEKWIRATFLNEDSELYNVEHSHLDRAVIGVLWTNIPNSKGMRPVAGTAEMPLPQGSKWQKERAYQQLTGWFGEVPDFLLTFDATYCAGIEPIVFCSLVEHELYHCAQKHDAFGVPLFNKSDGKPKFGILRHDVEEFVGIVRRYGIDAAAGKSRAFVEAAKLKPEISSAQVKALCGTCAR